MYKLLTPILAPILLTACLIPRPVWSYPFNSEYFREYKNRQIASKESDLTIAVGKEDYTKLVEGVKKSCSDAVRLGRLWDDREPDTSPMVFAIMRWDIFAIKILEQCSATTINPYETILTAAEWENFDIFHHFYEMGLAQKCTDDELFYYAIKGGNSAIIEFLQDKGHKLNLQQPGLLNVALTQLDINLVKTLLDSGLDPNKVGPIEGWGWAGEDWEVQELPLFSAMRQKSPRNADGDGINREGILLLLDYGANPFLGSNGKYQRKSLFEEWLGDEYSRLPIMDILEHTKKNYKIDEKNKYTYLKDAYKHFYVEYVESDNNKKINKEQEEIIIKFSKELLTRGAAVNADVLMEASNLGSKKLLNLLLEHMGTNAALTD